MKKQVHNQTKEKEEKELKENLKSKKRNYTNRPCRYYRCFNHFSNNKY